MYFCLHINDRLCFYRWGVILENVFVLISRNVTVNGRRTSMRLDEIVWNALRDIAKREEKTIHDLCSEVEKCRGNSSLTAATRVFVVSYFRAAVTPQGLDRLQSLYPAARRVEAIIQDNRTPPAEQSLRSEA